MREAVRRESPVGLESRHRSKAVSGVQATGVATPQVAAQRALGNRSFGLVQPKLTIGRPNDRFEREANRVADMVMAPTTPVPNLPDAISSGSPTIQRCACAGKCNDCAGDKELLLQRAAVVGTAVRTAAPIPITPLPAHRIQRDAADTCALADEPLEEGEEEDLDEPVEELAEADAEPDEADAEGEEPAVQPKRAGKEAPKPESLETRLDRERGRGAPLPADARAFMEARFGYDLSPVRIHTGSQADHLNRDIRSLAFTSGTDIYFGAGHYRPDTPAGMHLLAHELTHVVQQAGGGGGLVQEKVRLGTVSRSTRPERKPYYRHRVSGQFVHAVLERILRNANTDLVTEAAIPGANRHGPRLNRIGVADLYESTPRLTVAGVKGFREIESESDVVNMNNPQAVGTQPPVSSSPMRTPTVGDGGRGWSGHFPSEVSLGEIKPLDVTMAGAGIAQLDSYDRGYRAFVERVHAVSGGLTRPSIGVGRLSVTVPPRLDFDQWRSQHTTPSSDTTVGIRRLWVADVRNGMYVYFDLARDLRGPPPSWHANQIRELRGLKRRLEGNHPRTPRMASGKFLPGGPAVAVPGSAAPPGGTRRIQRSTRSRPANYWRDQGREWERERSTWARQFRQALRERYRGYREKMRVEKRLGRLGRRPPPSERERIAQSNQLQFWSGRGGRFVGRIRFLFGSAWDRIQGVFERMKERKQGLRRRVQAVPTTGSFAIGWRRTLIRVLVQASKTAVGRFITESFNFFVGCFQSAMNKVVEKFRGEVDERLGESLCNARLRFEESKERLEAEWGEAIQTLEELLQELQDTRRWLDIATGLISVIRAGVQVVSCLSPPALGCLWGLAAQVGISAALNLVIGTQWFNENVVTPTVQELVRRYATPHYQSLVNRALGEELREYHCEAPQTAFPSLDLTVTGGLAGSELIAHRDAWEAEHESEVVQELLRAFRRADGTRVTPEDLRELARLLQESGRSVEELQAMVRQARDPASGRLDLGRATAYAEHGEVSGAAARERDIDYTRAMRNNPVLQRLLGWDPMTFYRRPGVDVESEEFADAVYDTQEALGIRADGMLGEATLIAFYDRNRLRRDRAYAEAMRIRAERQAAREATAEATRGETAAEPDGPVVAVPVTEPHAGARIVGRAPHYLSSSPGFVGIPYGVPRPEKDSYEPGESLRIDVLRWYSRELVAGGDAMDRPRWIWLPAVPAEYVSMSSLNDNRIMMYEVREDLYYRLSPESNTVAVVTRGRRGLYLDWAGLP